jgi:hypothetical protein
MHGVLQKHSSSYFKRLDAGEIKKVPSRRAGRKFGAKKYKESREAERRAVRASITQIREMAVYSLSFALQGRQPFPKRVAA